MRMWQRGVSGVGTLLAIVHDMFLVMVGWALFLLMVPGHLGWSVGSLVQIIAGR